MNERGRAWRSLMSFDISLQSQRPTVNLQLQIPLIGQKKKQKNDRKQAFERQMRKLGDKSMKNYKYKKTGFRARLMSWARGYRCIEPYSGFLLFWNTLNIVGIAFNFIWIPIVLLFVVYVGISDIHSLPLYIINGVFLLIFLIDLLFIRWRIAYRNNQGLVTDCGLILMNYLKLGFWLDLIVWVCILLSLVLNYHVIWIKIVFLLKFHNCYHTVREIDCNIFNPYAYAFYRFFGVLIIIFAVTNIIGCLYFAIDYSYYQQQGFYYQNGFLWLTGSQTVNYMNVITTFPWYVWYQYAIYWSIQTTASIGYGNMTPRNPVTTMFCNLVIIFTLFIFVFFANTILDIAAYLKQNIYKVQESLQSLHVFQKHFQTQRKIKFKLQNHVQNYLVQKKDSNINQQVVNTFSEPLKKSVILAYHSKILENLQIFRLITIDSNGLWNSFAYQISQIIQSRIAYKQQQIVSPFTTQGFQLWMISRGKVFQMNLITKKYQYYNQCDYFGQFNFFFGGKSIMQLTCSTFTILYHIDKSVFCQIIKKNPVQYQKYLQKIHSVSFNNVKKDAVYFGITDSSNNLIDLFNFLAVDYQTQKYTSNQQQQILNNENRRSFARKSYKNKKIKRIAHLNVIIPEKVFLSQAYFSQYNIKSS